MSKSNERNPNVAQIVIGTLVSSSTVVVPGLYFRKHSRIKNVYFADQTGITKDNTNHVGVTLQDLSSVAYAALDTSDAAAVANTPLALALNSPDDADVNHLEKDVPAGTMLNIAIAAKGTAVLTKAVAIVEWYPL